MLPIETNEVDSVMAYMSQDRKRSLAPAIKTALKKYRVKGTLAVDNNMALVLNIKSGPIDFISNFNAVCSDSRRADPGHCTPVKNYVSVNPYWYHEHFTDKALAFLKEVISAMNDGNWNKSDIQSDYHDVGWYVHVNIGNWNKPYVLEK